MGTWRKRFRVAAAVALMLALAFCGRFNQREYKEAFGEGSPHYGRTTNMDKWDYPTPTLVKVNIVCSALAVLLGYALYRLRRKSDERSEQ